MKILLLWICISISMYINFKNKNEESSLNINYIWDCFIGDWKLYIFYYCIFYYLFLQTSIPAPNKPIWQYYFPIKLSVLMMACIFANLHGYFKNLLSRKEHNFKKVCIVTGLTFFINAYIASIIVQLIQNLTGINLWFLIYV